MNLINNFKSKPIILVLCSAGGAVFQEIIKGFNNYVDFYLIVDRDCPALNVANAFHVPYKCIIEKDNKILSNCIMQYAKSIRASALLCFFGRILTEKLINFVPCYNVHPSILPKYPGLNAEKKAYENQDPEIGATLHKIDVGLDTGQKLFEYKMNIEGYKTFEKYKRLSYICKTKVSYCFLEYGLLYGFSNINITEYQCELKLDQYKERFDEFIKQLI